MFDSPLLTTYIKFKAKFSSSNRLRNLSDAIVAAMQDVALKVQIQKGIIT
jgi:hypothetical protein